MGGASEKFPSTHWSAIVDLRDPAHPAYRRHLEELIRGYWRPVYFYVRAAWRHSIEDAKDLTQEFFAQFLEKRWFEKLDPGRGSFRGYLKTAVRHFLVDRKRASERQRRAPEGVLLHFEQAETDFGRIDPAGREATPEEIFDAEWVRTVVRETLERLGENLRAEGKGVLHEMFLAYSGLGREPDTSPPTYEALARRFGLEVLDVKHGLTYVRQELRNLVRERVRAYVHSDAEADEEIQFVLGSR